ncbi:GNAT family N-acetyltransferase [Salinicoccus sesuvii]|uniref:GNAT family N-acetyltransferase n=1 Tax=Salinicoccus sesuvii TaxID=868281 RepID=A0ABV7N5L6_9STAP
MSSHVKILKENDLPTLKALMPLYKDLGYPITMKKLRELLAKIIEHEDYTFLLLIKEDEIVGFSGLCKMMFYEKEDHYMRILAFVIKSEYQNQGLGRILLRESEELAKEKGCCAIILNSGNREERNIAHKFYVGNGYQIKTSGFLKLL